MIGAISLNISLMLYLILYMPQIIHNCFKKNIYGLSFCMHCLLYVGYILDLFYGFCAHLPWQYKVVSITGAILISIQHLQITHSFWRTGQRSARILSGLNGLFFCCILCTSYFLSGRYESFSENTTFIAGFVSRACFLLYVLPQIIKNYKLKEAESISIQFVYLSLILSILDMISAWCLDWGWPNKLAGPFSISLIFVLLMQKKRYGA